MQAKALTAIMPVQNNGNKPGQIIPATQPSFSEVKAAMEKLFTMLIKL